MSLLKLSVYEYYLSSNHPLCNAAHGAFRKAADLYTISEFKHNI